MIYQNYFPNLTVGKVKHPSRANV